MTRTRIILIAIIAAVAGLFTGYLVFHDVRQASHDHTAESGRGVSEQIWTCSMHPQIRQNEPGQCPICGMDLIPLSQSSSGNPLVLEMTPEAVKLANIQTVVVGSSAAGGSGSDGDMRHLTGRVKADERRVASQVTHIPGRIEKLFVSFTGEKVYAGQKLATLYSPELVSAQRELIEAARLQETMPYLLEAARTKLQYWKIPAGTIAEIESSGQIQPNVTVVTQHSGVIMERHVAVGDYIREGEVLFDIVNLDRVWVLFDAYEEDLRKIRTGDKVTFTTPVAPGRTFETKVSFIDPVINPETRVASLRAEVANAGGLLKPEMLVRGTITIGTKTTGDALAVPRSAVLWTGTRSVVYVEDTSAAVPSYRYREVTLGDQTGDMYVILDGLEDGERVVVNGAFVIDAAAQLNNMASMMNRYVTPTGLEATGPDFTGLTPRAFQEQIHAIVEAYLQLKDALVLADTAEAAEQAGAVLGSLAQVDMSLLEGESHQYWMEAQQAIETHGKQIAEAGDIEKQRMQFDFLSQAFIEALRAFGTKGDTLYIQHCPMAFDNQGADWISDEAMIRNPYFGDKMLKCGSVTSTISDTRSATPATSQNQIHQH